MLPPTVALHHPTKVGSPHPGLPAPKPPTLKQVPGSSSHCRLGGTLLVAPGCAAPAAGSGGSAGGASSGLLSLPAAGARHASSRGHSAPWGDTRQSDTAVPWLLQEHWSRDTDERASARGGSARDPPCVTLAGSALRIVSPALRLEGSTRTGSYPQDVASGSPWPPHASHSLPVLSQGPKPLGAGVPTGTWGCHQLRSEVRRD